MLDKLKKIFQKLDLFLFKVFVKIEKKLFPKRYLPKPIIECKVYNNMVERAAASYWAGAVVSSEGNLYCAGDIIPKGVTLTHFNVIAGGNNGK